MDEVFKKVLILAVDDDPGDLELLKRKLLNIKDPFVEVIACLSWREARSKLEHHPIQIVVVDYLLGESTGLDILTSLREQKDDRPVIVLTGRGDEKIAAQVTRAGADDYLIKGELTSDMLRRSITMVLRQYSLRKEKEVLAEELQQARRLEEIGTMAAGLAHDFNNMLTAILGHIELIKIKSVGRNVQEDITVVQGVCMQMAELVQTLLSFSRHDCSHIGPINVQESCREIQMILRHSLPKNVNMQLQAPDTPLVINGSAANLQQILMNLCLNGADAMPNGGILTVKMDEVLITADQLAKYPDLTEGRHVVLEVRDTGDGIAPGIKEKVFLPFFTTKGFCSKKGTGLGLTLVWQNVKNLGGFISVCTKPGNGTTFRILFPIVEEALPKPNVDLPEKEPFRGEETILLVDDEEVVRDVASRILQHLGYKVYTASDGYSAIQIYKVLHVDIDMVLLDISMPRMDGKSCIKELMAVNPTVPVLFASGHDLTEHIDELISLGAKGMIQKPYQIHTLSRRIRAVLEGSLQEKAIVSLAS